MNRPTANGSSDSTVELLMMLVTFGASALTVLALAPRRPKPDRENPARDADAER